MIWGIEEVVEELGGMQGGKNCGWDVKVKGRNELDFSGVGVTNNKLCLSLTVRKGRIYYNKDHSILYVLFIYIEYNPLQAHPTTRVLLPNYSVELIVSSNHHEFAMFAEEFISVCRNDHFLCEEFLIYLSLVIKSD